MWKKKGEIARYEQFLLFPTVSSKDLQCRYVKTRACFGKGKKYSKCKTYWEPFLPIEHGQANTGCEMTSYCSNCLKCGNICILIDI